MWGSAPLPTPPQCSMSESLPGNLPMGDLHLHCILTHSFPSGTPWCFFTPCLIQHLLKKSFTRDETLSSFPSILFPLLETPSKYHHVSLREGLGSKKYTSVKRLGEEGQSNPHRCRYRGVIGTFNFNTASVTLPYRSSSIIIMVYCMSVQSKTTALQYRAIR